MGNCVVVTCIKNQNVRKFRVRTVGVQVLRYWQTRTHCCGHIVAHDVSLRAQTGKHFLRTQNVSEQNQKHFLCPQQMLRARANGETFVSGDQCVCNNVSSFASSFIQIKPYNKRNLTAK